MVYQRTTEISPGCFFTMRFEGPDMHTNVDELAKKHQNTGQSMGAGIDPHGSGVIHESGPQVGQARRGDQVRPNVGPGVDFKGTLLGVANASSVTDAEFRQWARNFATLVDAPPYPNPENHPPCPNGPWGYIATDHAAPSPGPGFDAYERAMQVQGLPAYPPHVANTRCHSAKNPGARVGPGKAPFPGEPIGPPRDIYGNVVPPAPLPGQPLPPNAVSMNGALLNGGLQIGVGRALAPKEGPFWQLAERMHDILVSVTQQQVYIREKLDPVCSGPIASTGIPHVLTGVFHCGELGETRGDIVRTLESWLNTLDGVIEANVDLIRRLDI